jgi:hypothetical protein
VTAATRAPHPKVKAAKTAAKVLGGKFVSILDVFDAMDNYRDPRGVDDWDTGDPFKRIKSEDDGYGP